MNTIQITIQSNEEQQEMLISQLEDLNATGFEQTTEYLVACFPENNFNSYEVNQLLKGFDFHILTLEEQNWNAVWESNFQPVVVGNFCGIRADFHEPLAGVKYEIVITPKMSFGTGHHATTYMVIEQMQGLDFVDKTVFDFGTGTGILAILAEKSGAAGIIAIDVDEWSIANAEENIIKNQCSRIEVSLSSAIPQQKFDIILANINRNVILQYLPRLAEALPKGKYLLLSGLLTTDEKEIVEACQHHNLNLLKQIQRNNWISLLFVNGISPSD